MKRYCKNIDISDRSFIKASIEDCLREKYKRNDVIRLLSEYSHLPKDFIRGIAESGQYWMFDGIIDTITESIRMEILEQKYSWKPVWYTYKIEGNKRRRIGIQDIKQQIYDYIAVRGLQELFDKRIGFYQCAALPGKGQIVGKNAIKRKLRSSKSRWGWKGDGKKYYENINRRKLKRLLRKYVKNDPLLHLTFALIDSFEKGLSIGSYLSQYLANFYMSFLYRHITENLFRDRWKKDGTVKRVRMINFCLIYMDDIYISGPNLKLLKMAVKRIRKFAEDFLDITIKEDDEWIDFKSGEYLDMMGFVMSKEKVIVRPSIFRRYRKSIAKARKTGKIDREDAKRIISRDGWIKNADCAYFRKRSKADKIVNKCKELMKSDKNVIYLAARQGQGCAAA